MKVLEKGKLPDGTEIQIEEWSENYSNIPFASTLGCYAISKMTRGGIFGPRAGESYRFQYDFISNEEAKIVFDSLVSGNKVLSDFTANMHNKNIYADCI